MARRVRKRLVIQNTNSNKFRYSTARPPRPASAHSMKCVRHMAKKPMGMLQILCALLLLFLASYVKYILIFPIIQCALRAWKFNDSKMYAHRVRITTLTRM